jgi:Domain of unknown function (DUF929)
MNGVAGLSKNKRQVRDRERARQIVAEQRRAEQRRRRLVIAGAAVALVVLALGTLIVVKVTGHGKAKPPAKAATQASDQITAALAAVPAAVLDKVGTGKVDNPPKAVSGQQVLADNGKPLVVYIGAEYCPFCAAQRWAAVVALSRFGTFAGLGQTRSSSTDVYPNTATLSFHGATYTSQYLAFQGVETQSNQPRGNSYAPLDTLTAQQEQLLKTFNAPPYVSADAAGSIPFVDFANQGVVSGASYSPELLTGKTAEQITAALSDPANPITQAIGGSANAFTTMLCQLTGGQPGAVCTSSAASAYQGKLNGAR